MEETKMTEMAVDAWVRELKNSVETGKITIEYDSDGVDVTSSLGKYKSGVTSKRVTYLIDSIVDHFIKNYDFVIVKHKNENQADISVSPLYPPRLIVTILLFRPFFVV